jgi:hypothetical protein
LAGVAYDWTVPFKSTLVACFSLDWAASSTDLNPFWIVWSAVVPGCGLSVAARNRPIALFHSYELPASDGLRDTKFPFLSVCSIDD